MCIDYLQHTGSSAENFDIQQLWEESELVLMVRPTMSRRWPTILIIIFAAMHFLISSHHWRANLLIVLHADVAVTA